jgi:hypothetical protein
MGASLSQAGVLELPNDPNRPKNISELMYDGLGVYSGQLSDGWKFANQGKNRFYLLNLVNVMAALRLEHTKTANDFLFAPEIIKKHTTWPDQYDDLKTNEPPYTRLINVSHTQINLDKRDQAKLFSHAVIAVVALESAAARIKPDYSVYEHLRILPAHYFIDGLTDERLARLEKFHAKLNDKELEQIYGEAVVRKKHSDKSLSALSQTAIKQDPSINLLKSLSFGCCATKFVCDGLLDLINRYPEELHIGPVRESGDQRKTSAKLGVRNVAPGLIVPATLDVSVKPKSLV